MLFTYKKYKQIMVVFLIAQFIQWDKSLSLRSVLFAKRTSKALDSTSKWEYLKHQKQQVKAVLKGT